MKIFFRFVMVLLGLLFFLPAYADTIILLNGNTIEGKIVERTGKYIKLESAGVSLTYYLDGIKSINGSTYTKQAPTPALNNRDLSAVNDEKDPVKILEKVKAAYQSLETYKASGTITMDMGNMKSNTDFNIVLKKPNLYLISWVQNTPMGTGGMTQAGAVWNDGTQPYLFMGIENSYSKMKSDEIALDGAAGISGGVTSSVPMFFLSVSKSRFSILKLVNPVLEGMERVENEDCYVITGSSPLSNKETFWISQSTYLIRKYSRSLQVPGGVKIPEMTDEQIDKIIKATGMEDTAENRQRMRGQMKMAEDFVKSSKMQGTSTETYGDISSPDLKKEDFKFQLPEGVVLKESIF